MGGNEVAAEIRIEIVEEDEVVVKERVTEEKTEALEYRLENLHKAIDDGLSDLQPIGGGEVEDGEMDSETHYRADEIPRL